MQIRKSYFISLVIIVVLLATSFYLEYYQGVMPCPLCTMQRFTFGLLGILSIIGMLVARHQIPRLFIHVLFLLFSITGIALAGRQIWLQNFPSSGSNECGVTLQYMASVLPFNELVQKILQGSAECTTRGWEFLYLNIAEWSVVWFAFFLLLSIGLIRREFKTRLM